MTVVGRRDANDWQETSKENLRTRQCIDPIPYTPRDGDGKFFVVKISDEELQGLIDENGNLRYHHVHEWVLPKLCEESYLEWIAAYTRHYMLDIVLHDGYTPRFCKPKEDHVILADHVARFSGCQHARMMCGHSSIEYSWSTCDLLHYVGACAESMPLSAFEDMHRCLYFADEWEEDTNAD